MQTFIDFSVNLTKNNLVLIGIAVTGFSASFTINVITHKVFDLKEGSYASYAAKIIAFGAGSALAIYVFSKMTIVDFPIAAALIMLPIPGGVLGALSLAGRSIVCIGLGLVSAGIGMNKSPFNILD